MRCDPTYAPLTPALGPSANKGINPIRLRDLILTSRHSRHLEGWMHGMDLLPSLSRGSRGQLFETCASFAQAIKSQQN
jgi:hypothetical protein